MNISRIRGHNTTTGTPARTLPVDPPEDLSLEDYFQRFVLEHQDSMSETELAQKLGVSRKCLWERRQRFGIPRQKNSAGSRSKNTQITEAERQTNVTGS